MRSNFKNISQQAAYIQAQRLVCLLLLAEYAKRLNAIFSINPDGTEVTLYPSVKVIRSASGAQEQIGTAIADSQGWFSIQNVILKEGANTFTATATDAAWNASSESLPISAVLDTMPPVIEVTAPANNSYTNVAAVKVTGSLNEDASLTINGTETRAIGQSPLQFDKDITLTSGINSIQLTAKDAVGNQTTSTVLVTLDQAAPVVTITSPVSGAVVSSSTVTVTGTINEPVTNLVINGASVGATAVVSGQ